jgi:hypothetical protein
VLRRRLRRPREVDPCPAVFLSGLGAFLVRDRVLLLLFVLLCVFSLVPALVALALGLDGGFESGYGGQIGR